MCNHNQISGNALAASALSPALLRRLPLYHQYLLEAQGEGNLYISATQIAAALKIHHTQVRQDFDALGVRGFPKRGHPLEASIHAIEKFFGNNRYAAFLLGAGNLGRALIGYKLYETAGIRIVAAFDKDNREVGTAISGIEIYPLTRFIGLARRMRIDLAVVALPPAAADEACRLIIDSGIGAVLNLMPSILRLPLSIIVENVNIISSLTVLTAKIAGKRHFQEAAHVHGKRNA